jgi:Na+-driven multidrug efflux pump
VEVPCPPQATSIRTGLYLGAANPGSAKRATWIGVSIAASTSFVLSLLVYFVPRLFAQ